MIYPGTHQVNEIDDLLTDHKEIIRRIKALLFNIKALNFPTSTFTKADRNSLVSLMFTEDDYQLETWDNANRRRNM